MTALGAQLSAVYRFSEVCRVARITNRQMDYAIRAGDVQFLQERGPGSGHPRRFRAVDVHVAAVLGRVAAFGAHGRDGSGPGLRRVVARRLYELPRPWQPAWLVVYPDPHQPGVAVCPTPVPSHNEYLVNYLGEAQWVLRLPPELEPLS